MSVVSEGLFQRWSVAAGYYSYAEGANLIDPLATGTRYAHLVALHESRHENLAHNNFTDGYGRLFTPALTRGRDQLGPDHRTLVWSLMSVIDDTTAYCHELLATYTSFQLLAMAGLGRDLAGARRELPKAYRRLLADGERSFGPVGEGEPDRLIRVAETVLACAIAALNLPFPPGLGRFDRLRQCMAFLKANPPDERFRAMLGAIRPGGRRSGVLRGLHDIPFEDVQAFVFERLREALPRHEFVRQPDRPDTFRQWVAELMDDCERHGYTFMRGAQIVPADSGGQGPHGLLDGLDAPLRLDGLAPFMPLDLSLVRDNYARGDVDQLTNWATAVHLAGERLLAHVAPAKDETAEPMRIWCVATTPDFPRLEVHTMFGRLLEALADLPRQSVILKIDERYGLETAKRLAATGHPVFVLAHDTRTGHLTELVTGMARGQTVRAGAIGLQDSGNYAILVAWADRDRFAILSPVTRLGYLLMRHHLSGNPAIRFNGEGESVLDIVRQMGSGIAFFPELLSSTYGWS